MAKTIEVEIEGVSPYLMHRFPMDGADNAETVKTGRKDYSQEVEKALYLAEDGTIYIPSTCIEGCLIKTASNFQISGRGKKTYKDLIKSALIVTPTEIPISPQKWATDARPVVVQRSRVIRYRPRWDKWKLKFKCLITDDQLPTEVVKKMLVHGGMYQGIGDFRPKFGRFQVNSVKEID